jgi:tetratricopeptide (TPR) repeat protein
MRVSALILLGVSGLIAADSQQLVLALKAQSDFDRVTLSPVPVLADVGNCQQSQAAALAVSSVEEASLLYYRRGYCTLAGAAITNSNREFFAAAADFDRAIAAWPARLHKSQKNQTPEPLSSGLRVLPWIARLHAWTDDSVRSTAEREITAALDPPSCLSNLMPVSQCEQLLQTGRQWLGWIALKQNRLDDAAKGFVNAETTGWPDWIQGRRQFQQGKYPAAVHYYTDAIRIWRSVWQDPGPSLARRLGPSPDLPQALSDLGGAQLLAGDTKGAIASLDASIKADPSNPQALYRRARAYDIAGKPEQALGDYNLASRTAFANAQELASGEAHLYRGIMLYRRKDFVRAEDEFSSALNFEIPESLRADARGWRHMAAAAAGSCASARELDRTLPSVSPYFPRDEAQKVASTCSASAQLAPRN